MAKPAPSILQRTIWFHLLTLAGVAVGFLAAVYFLLNATTDDFEKRLLRGHAVSAAHYLVFAEGRWSMHLPADMAAVYSGSVGGYALTILNQDGGVIYSSLPDKSALFPAGVGAGEESFHRNLGSSVYYGISTAVRRSGQTAWIQVGQNLENPDVILDDVVALFLGRILWIVALISIVLIVVDVILMRRLIAPVTAASHVASAIGPHQPLARLPVADLPREILPLAVAMNQALDRLEEGLEAQREFTADAAHELRTPLAILRTHVDTTLEGPVAQALRNDIDTMSDIVDQLLELAALEDMGADRMVQIDLNAVCADVVDLMTPLAKADGKSLELANADAPVRITGDFYMLSRAIRNLVENAIRHSRRGTAVEVAVAPPGVVLVKDRGPGIKPAEREMMFKRFWRLNRRERGHAGLGLAIVAKIVSLHGGAVAVDDREGGGTVISVRLPSAPDAPD